MHEDTRCDENLGHERLSEVSFSRRRFVGVTGVAVAGAASGAFGYGFGRRGWSDQDRDPGLQAVLFHGRNQPGVATAQQRHLVFAAFEASVDGRIGLRELLRTWTAAAGEITRGVREQSLEVRGRSSARLTVAFGFGLSLFDERFGLASLQPPALTELPRFRRQRLDPSRSGGDLCIHACAEDPDVAFNAVRTLAELARGSAVPRWVQQGFRSGGAGGSRNLLGFRDGTNNLDASDERLMAKHVWVGEEDEPEWMRNGTYMVVRRIRVRLEHWDSISVAQQERAIGRRKRSGAPFGARRESDPVDPASLPPDSHVAQARPASDEERILRRSYLFVDGLDPRFGEWDAGLFFICFQRDPRRQFVPIQRRLSENDRLSEYVVHTGSAIFAIPPGVEEGGYVGQTLFESL